jgi:hypothetical protein
LKNKLSERFELKMLLRAICLGALCSWVLAGPGVAGSDSPQNGHSIAMLTTEGSPHQSAKPDRPEVAESCFLTWEETEEEREARERGEEYAKTHYSPFLKICYYDCLGAEVSMEIAAGQPCPPTIR